MFLWLLDRDVCTANGIYHLGPGCHTLGRSVNCDIHIDDESVSRVHALVVHDWDSILVRDMASSNGTFVNEVRVRESRLVSGDRLRLGRVLFDVTEGSDALASLGLDDDETTPPISRLKPDPHARLEQLTGAQRRVLRLLLAGLPEKRIADRLRVSRHTVHNHTKEIYRTVRVQSRAELLALLLPA